MLLFTVEAQVIIGPMNTTAEILFDTVLFTCVGYAIPIATIKWEKSGNSISNDTEVKKHMHVLVILFFLSLIVHLMCTINFIIYVVGNCV